jgi:N-acetylneuraminic acid mutarotase
MGMKKHKIFLGNLVGALRVSASDRDRLTKYSTRDLLKTTFRMLKLTVLSFRKNNRLLSRVLDLLLVVLIIFGVIKPIIDKKLETPPVYNLSKFSSLLDAPNEAYAKKLVYDAEKQMYKFNEGYVLGGDQRGDSSAAKVTATFASLTGNNAVKLTDPVNSVDITVTPKFKLSSPTSSDNRVVYQLTDLDGVKVYTLKGSGIKEDIILNKAPSNDAVSLDYDVQLPAGMELRIEGDGSLGAYGVDSSLLGKVSTGTDADKQLLDKARENGEKNKLLFKIPAPFVVEQNKKQSAAKAWFSLNEQVLTLHAAGLKSANYPLSIDPTIYVETAQQFMRGNNETNIDYDPTNELIQKSQTTGARINGWQDSTDLSAGLWDHSVAMAGGYVYRAGGRVDPTMPYLVDSRTTSQGTAGTTFVLNMPTLSPVSDLYVTVISRVGTGTITPPAGWLLYTTGTNVTSATRDVVMYYKIGGASEPATYSWTNSASVKWTGTVLRIKGFDSATPISSSTAATTGTSTSLVSPVFSAITPAQDASLIIRAIGINEVDPSQYTWLPAGHSRLSSSTSIADTASSTALVITSVDAPPLATVAAPAASLALDGIMIGNYGAVSLAIKPAVITAGYQKTVEWAQVNGVTATIDSPNPGAGVCAGWCTNSIYDLPANRVGMSMVSYNGYLYAMGGSPGGATDAALAAAGTNTVWISKLGANGEPQLWHPSGGTPVYWYPSTNVLPANLSYTSVAAYKNRLYLVGGRDTAGSSITAVRTADFLPTGDIGAWSVTGMQDLTVSLARYGHSVHIYNDTMYVLGGSNNGTLLNTVYYSKLNADGTMNGWQPTSNFTTPRSSFGGLFTSVLGGYVYMAGGCAAVTTGYCSTIASDVQLASIDADGTLGPWNSILNLSNQRIGGNFLSWQGGLYRMGGCNRQNTSTGTCYATHRGVEYGAVNTAGDASTVSNSSASGSGLCTGGSPVNCNLPPAGDVAGAATGGQMSSMVVVNNGYIYNIGGCIAPATSCTDMSGNISYAALNSTGQMVAPTNCPTNTTYGLWCIDSVNQLNGTAGLGAGAATVFNNIIYIIGGTDAAGAWKNNAYRVGLNSDGSLNGPWITQTFASVTLDVDISTGGTYETVGYSYAFTRANPVAASSNPGNLYVLGGCISGAAGIGCNTYSSTTNKCNITSTGAIAACSTTGQMIIDADNVNAGVQGLGLMAGTVYANRLYLVGGSCTAGDAGSVNPCSTGGSNFSANRRDTIYAQIDSSNNIVDATTGLSSGTWKFSTAQMSPVRRRAVSFGYNGYIYSLAGYSGSNSLQDLLFAKINVSTGNLSPFSSSGVVVTPRWDLRAVVSNGYVYAIGGCAAGAAPAGCTAMQPQVQTFQLYNNDSGTPINYTPSANQFATDRIGASSTILNGYIYVAGGCTSASDCTTATASVQYAPIDINGAIGVWSGAPANDLPAARSWGQLESIGGSLYYIGGQDSASASQSTVYYTTGITSGAPTWSGTVATNGLPAVRTKFSAAVWDDRIYVTGGLDGASASTATTYISPKLSAGGNITSTWSTAPGTFNIARSGHTTIAYANNLYVLGGYDGTNYLSDSQFISIGYKAGTITQSGTSLITGSATGGQTWTTAMIGSTLQYRDGEVATILTVPTANTMTVSVSKNVTAGTGYTILDGSIGTGVWSYSTSLPTPLAGADGYGANGYLYLVGGRTSSGNCSPNTLLAPVSANTTISSGNNATGVGEWYSTNVKYTGDRYGAAVAYDRGKLYVAGGACESFPTVTSITKQSFATDTTSHAVTMPAVVDPGDLLLTLFTNNGNATVTTPAGWTAVTNGTQVETTVVRGSVFAKNAVGTEDGLNVDFVTSATEQAASQVYRIPAGKWSGNLAGVEATNAAGSVTNVPNPPLLDPTTWAAENTLWISYVAGASYATTTTYPTNYLNGTQTVAGVTTTGATVSSARRELNATSDDPAAFAMPSTSSGVPFTIAIRPAAFAYTGVNRMVQTGLYSQPQVAAYSRLIDTDTDVFPTSWLMNGLDNSIGARWRLKYRSMHDINPATGGSDSVLTTPPSTYTLQQNPNEDCGTSTTMPVMTTWGQETDYGNVTLGDVASYTPKNGAGANINCARYFYFFTSIDSSQTFGYPEDVNRGPTISDLTLLFTSDPSKRLRHGKTFTGGEKQPLDAPCRQTVDANCPLP